ncbi:MAG: DUF504 domain-containing protein [Candidatus Nitrosopolaris sp.]
MSKKGRLEEIFSKAIYSDDPKLYSVYYRDCDSFVKVSISEFVKVSQNFELIPSHRVMTITRDGKVLYFKKQTQRIDSDKATAFIENLTKN